MEDLSLLASRDLQQTLNQNGADKKWNKNKTLKLKSMVAVTSLLARSTHLSLVLISSAACSVSVDGTVTALDTFLARFLLLSFHLTIFKRAAICQSDSILRPHSEPIKLKNKCRPRIVRRNVQTFSFLILAHTWLLSRFIPPLVRNQLPFCQRNRQLSQLWTTIPKWCALWRG